MKVYEMESVLLAGISKREFLEKLIEHCWQIIYLTRTNKVKHNLSSYRAHQTAIFHTKVSLPPLSMEIDCFKFKHGILQLLNWEKEERELLDGIPYLELQYELHLENNLAHQLAVKTVLSYLDLPYINAITKHVKVLRGDLSEFITNYDEFVDTMLKCGYQKHLE
jgi:LPS sulfotransferase NodH